MRGEGCLVMAAAAPWQINTPQYCGYIEISNYNYGYIEISKKRDRESKKEPKNTKLNNGKGTILEIPSKMYCCIKVEPVLFKERKITNTAISRLIQCQRKQKQYPTGEMKKKKDLKHCYIKVESV